MNDTVKMIGTLVGGILVGYLLGTYGAGQFVAVATAERDAERDEQNASHAAAVTSVIDAAAAKLDELRIERDEAVALVLVQTPKDVQGHV